MAISIGWILGPLDLILAGAALYLLFKNRNRVRGEHKLVLDYTAISIICALFWGAIGGTLRHVGILDDEAATFISLVLSTLYLIFSLLAVWHCVKYLDGNKTKKKR